MHRRKRTLQVLWTLTQQLDAFVSGTPLLPPLLVPSIVPPEEQRVTSVTAPVHPTIQRVTAAPPTILANNPTAPQVLQTKQQMHQRVTQKNTPGALPAMNRAHRIPELLIFTKNIKHTPTPRPASTPTKTTPLCLNHLNSAKLPCFNNV